MVVKSIVGAVVLYMSLLSSAAYAVPLTQTVSFNTFSDFSFYSGVNESNQGLQEVDSGQVAISGFDNE